MKCWWDLFITDRMDRILNFIMDISKNINVLPLFKFFVIVWLIRYTEDDKNFVRIFLPFIMLVWVITLLWFPIISLFLSRSQVILYFSTCYIVASWYFVATFDIKLNIFVYKRYRQPHSIFFKFRKVFIFL